MAATDILTLAEARDVLELDGATHDGELAGLLSATSARIDSLCGPVVQRTVTSEKHDGGRPWVLLDQLYGVSASSVSEYDTAGNQTVLSAETESTKTSTDYLLDDVGKGLTKLWRRSNGQDYLFEHGRRNVLVTYTAGRYADTASVDELFKRAAGFMLTHLFKSTGPAWHTDREFFDGPVSGSAVPSFGVPRIVKEMLHDEMRPPAVA